MPAIKRTNAKPVSVKAARNATPAKPTAEAKPANKRNVAASTPATPDPRVARAERIAADRATVGKLYAAFNAANVSIPVKPLSAFKPLPAHAHAIARKPSIRQAAAIAVAIEAAGKKLANGAVAPRVFEHDNRRVALENGVLADAISSGLITVAGTSPETETLTIRNATAVIGLLGEKLLKQHKLL